MVSDTFAVDPEKKLGCEQYSTLILCTHVCEELTGLEAAMNRSMDAFKIVCSDV